MFWQSGSRQYPDNLRSIFNHVIDIAMISMEKFVDWCSLIIFNWKTPPDKRSFRRSTSYITSFLLKNNPWTKTWKISTRIPDRREKATVFPPTPAVLLRIFPRHWVGPLVEGQGFHSHSDIQHRRACGLQKDGPLLEWQTTVKEKKTFRKTKDDFFWNQQMVQLPYFFLEPTDFCCLWWFDFWKPHPLFGNRAFHMSFLEIMPWWEWQNTWEFSPYPMEVGNWRKKGLQEAFYVILIKVWGF